MEMDNMNDPKVQDILQWLDNARAADGDSFDVTEGALQIWRTLPEKIRADPSLATFRQEHERLHAGEPLPDDDPIPIDEPTDEVSKTTGKAKGGPAEGPKPGPVAGPAGGRVEINLTNEMGERRALGRETPVPGHAGNRIEEDSGIDTEPTTWCTYVKIGTLLIVWCVFTGFLLLNKERHIPKLLLSIPPKFSPKYYQLTETPESSRLGIITEGAFVTDYDARSRSESILYIVVQQVYTDKRKTRVMNVSDVWKVHMVDEAKLDMAEEMEKRKIFKLNHTTDGKEKPKLRVQITSDTNVSVAAEFMFDVMPIDEQSGVIYAALVLLGLYVLIIWEIVHRTFAAILASTLAVGVLAAINHRPSMEHIMSWIDVETLLLLFGMMILVAILSETGVFDYLAVYAYQITNGQEWPLITTLCIFTAITSSFLDNVTTVLLMTPVTIRLCEVMLLNPVPVLMFMVIYSNIGGTLTPVGDPPNVIIASNSYISGNGINFTVFTMHMFGGVVIAMISTYFQIRIMFRNMNDLRYGEAQGVQELKHEIAIWQRAAESLSYYSKDEQIVRETLLDKVNRLKKHLKKTLVSGSGPVENYEATLAEMRAKYPIRNKVLLYKSGVALTFVISLFFLHSLPQLQSLSLGWTALLGAILLLILANVNDIEPVLSRVEWSTLLFFAALFVLMEALSELGLITWIGNMTVKVIMSVEKESRLAAAILLILWVSAIASAFVDNIPLTTMMIKITISLAQNQELDLPLQPLVWALAFGACLGGNGTLIGASANVVCAGVAEQHGYKFSFVEYFKIGFPVMIVTVTMVSGYLMLCHVVFTWH